MKIICEICLKIYKSEELVEKYLDGYRHIHRDADEYAHPLEEIVAREIR